MNRRRYLISSAELRFGLSPEVAALARS